MPRTIEFHSDLSPTALQPSVAASSARLSHVTDESRRRYVAFTIGLSCEIAVACGGEGAGGPKRTGKAPPPAKLKEETRQRQLVFIEMLLLDQQLWHACLGDQVQQQQQLQPCTRSAPASSRQHSYALRPPSAIPLARYPDSTSRRCG